jgi:hypothetical protein
MPMMVHARIGRVVTRPRYLLVLMLVGAALLVIALLGAKGGT